MVNLNYKLNYIFARRSIRKYQDKAIPEEMLADLLAAAMAAPSAVAKDPWHFIVVQNRETLNKLTAILPNGKMLHQATAAFVVCGDISKAHRQQESYLLQDLSAAVENILLAANTLGLGTCWLGVHPREDRQTGIRQLFTLPAQIIPMCGIAIGWPAEQPEARTRYNPDRVHREKW
ncbi:MAG: nitroreductase family protein [Proteobacteria bacterium]|nr:nitroreductase family protein [Pseudomonadota bacterium]MBU1714339.1 nitroreductase family protein [Pseudomonadota bacterium]